MDELDIAREQGARTSSEDKVTRCGGEQDFVLPPTTIILSTPFLLDSLITHDLDSVSGRPSGAKYER